jgi:hypothetical protein
MRQLGITGKKFYSVPSLKISTFDLKREREKLQSQILVREAEEEDWNTST